MNKIILALTAAITFIVGIKEKFKTALDTVKERDKEIEELKAERENLLELLEAETRDDAALEAAVKEAREKQAAAEAAAEESKAKFAELEAGLADATAEADKLLAQTNEDAEIPVTVGEDGTVTSNTPPPLRGAE